MNGVLATIVIAAGLALAALAGLTALRDRGVAPVHLVAAAATEVTVLAMAAAAVVAMAGGQRPAEFATFLGYLLTALLLVPAGAVLGRMEPGRWGAVILAGAALVLPVLVLRLQQVWGHAGG